MRPLTIRQSDNKVVVPSQYSTPPLRPPKVFKYRRFNLLSRDVKGEASKRFVINVRFEVDGFLREGDKDVPVMLHVLNEYDPKVGPILFNM